LPVYFVKETLPPPAPVPWIFSFSLRGLTPAPYMAQPGSPGIRQIQCLALFAESGLSSPVPPSCIPMADHTADREGIRFSSWIFLAVVVQKLKFLNNSILLPVQPVR
jgi:hypothetical protein